MKHILTVKEFKRQTDMYDKAKFRCKCGHRVIIPVYVEKNICDWCGNYVFRDKKKEFEYRLKEKMK